MELYFLRDDFSLLDGPIDECSSVVWSERYFECGTFTVHLPRALLPRIRGASFLTDGEHTGRIEHLETSSDGDCEMDGRMLECLLGDRVMQVGCYSGSVTEAVLAGIRDNLRGMTLSFGDSVSLEEEVSLPAEWDALDEWVYSALKPYGASYRITLEEEDGVYLPVFRIVRGEENPGAVFSSSFGNLFGIELEQDSGEWKTLVYVEGGDGTVISVSDGGDASVRRELYKKASDIRPADFDSTADYRAALENRGRELLAKHPESLSVEAECDTDALPRYGADYRLGDVCQVEDEALALSFSLRLTAVDTVYEGGMRLICPSFGEKFRLFQRLKDGALRNS